MVRCPRCGLADRDVPNSGMGKNSLSVDIEGRRYRFCLRCLLEHLAGVGVPQFANSVEICEAELRGLRCTFERGHAGRHYAKAGHYETWWLARTGENG